MNQSNKNIDRLFNKTYPLKIVAGGALLKTSEAQDARSRFQPNGENTVDGIFVVAPQVTVLSGYFNNQNGATTPKLSKTSS